MKNWINIMTESWSRTMGFICCEKSFALNSDFAWVNDPPYKTVSFEVDDFLGSYGLIGGEDDAEGIDGVVEVVGQVEVLANGF